MLLSVKCLDFHCFLSHPLFFIFVFFFHYLIHWNLPLNVMIIKSFSIFLTRVLQKTKFKLLSSTYSVAKRLELYTTLIVVNIACNFSVTSYHLSFLFKDDSHRRFLSCFLMFYKKKERKKNNTPIFHMGSET